ncbi:MAG TPA: hypothetical protein VF713_01180 [Thermoanaerobaculia bacterium]
MRPGPAASVALSISVFFTLAAPTRHRAVTPPPSREQITSLDARRSMVVTDVALLSGFTFQRFLDQLITRGGIQNLTSAQLFQQ